jgi:hypothetical protein
MICLDQRRRDLGCALPRSILDTSSTIRRRGR